MSNGAQWLAGKVALLVGEGPGLKAVGEAIVAAGGQVEYGDFCDDLEGAKSVIGAHSGDQTSSIDILVHAGTRRAPVASETMSLADWRDTMKENLDSKFYYSSALANQVIGTDQRASILYLEPASAIDSTSSMASNGAMSSLTKTLATEWARDGIRVNAITSDVNYEGGLAQLQALGHLATYLCSDYAAYVTGASLGIED